MTHLDIWKIAKRTAALFLLLVLATACPDEDVDKNGESCTDEETLCGEDCADFDTSADHCGECGESCTTEVENAEPLCAGGECGFQCLDEFEECSGECADLDSDGSNCGACGNECLSGECEDGQCLPPACDAENDGDFGGGSGTADDPYTLCSAAHLQNIGSGTEFLSAHFTLSDDIDLSELGEPFEPIGSEEDSFQGTLDGYGFEIANLKIEEPEAISIHTGFFRIIGDEAVITNFRMVDVSIQGSRRVGALASTNEGHISDIAISGAADSGVEGSRELVGGVVGENFGTLVNISYSGHVTTGNDQVGGLVGNNEGTISHSWSAGSVTDRGYLGGLVGTNSGEISKSFSTSDVTGGQYIGGLVGENTGIIENSYTTGDVTVDAIWKVGGFTGSNTGTITHGYSIAQIPSEDAAGGFTGEQEGEITACYWDVDTSGFADGEEVAGEGLSTAEFADQDNFEGWDFEEVWTMADDEEGVTRPRLQWE